MESKNVTASSLADLDKKVQDLIAQGWQAEGVPVKNPDNTYSQRVVKNDQAE